MSWGRYISDIGIKAIKQYRLTFSLLVALLIVGFLSYSKLLTKEGFPAFQVPIIVVTGTYLGVDQLQIDQEIGLPLADDILADVSGSNDYQLTSYQSGFRLIVGFDQGLDLSQKQSEIDQILSEYQGQYQGLATGSSTVDATKYLDKYD